MKKSFFVALASILTLALSGSIQALYYGPHEMVVIMQEPFLYDRLTSYPAYDICFELDPKAALLSAGISVGVLSLGLGVCGIAQIAQGLDDFARGYVSYHNDGAELPRGIVAVSIAMLFGAVAVAALKAATK